MCIRDRNKDTWKTLDPAMKKAHLDVDDTNEYLGKLAKKYGTTIETLKSEKKVLDDSPTYQGEGEPVEKDLGGSNPEFVTKQAKALSYEDAICEIIDGIIENHQRYNDKNKTTDVKFRLLFGGKQLQVIENSGGIPREKFQSVATLGKSDWGQIYGVGVFGMGLKKAMRKISRSHHIFTWYVGGIPDGPDKDGYLSLIHI